MIQMQNQMKQMCEKMQGNQTDLSMQASVKRKASVVEEASKLSDDMPHNSQKSQNDQLGDLDFDEQLQGILESSQQPVDADCCFVEIRKGGTSVL